MEGNADLTSQLARLLEKNNNTIPIMISSSIQGETDDLYDQRKKVGEDYIFDYSEKHSIPIYVYRFANLYEKWSQPNYIMVIATYCNNIANDLPIQVNNPNAMITFQYIDDVVNFNCG